MNRKKREKLEKEPTINPKDYEGYSYGPLRLERIGRVVKISSNWKKGDFKKFAQDIKAKRPELRKEVNRKIKELFSIIEQANPLELLSTVSIRNCFVNPEEYRESTHEGKECYAEYAQSLILSCKNPSIDAHASEELIERFNSLIAEIFNYVLWYFGTEIMEDKRDKTEKELRFTSILRYLFVRGESFQEHHIELIRNLFKSHDSFLRKHVGFTVDEIITSIQNIEDQVLENVRQYSELGEKVRELHAIFKSFIEKEGTDRFSSIEEFRKEYLALPEVQEKYKELIALQKKLNENPFSIKPTEKAPEGLLKLLSSHFGDNEQFTQFEKTSGWPTNDSIVYEYPLIEHDGKYYCFVPQILFRNVGNILEAWIKERDETYFEKTYQKKRAGYLEKKALEYFRAILPSSRIFGKLFYHIIENGREKLAETDGLVLYDDNLFIIEAKAGSLSTSARRGGLERMKNDTAELIGNAYSQAVRTKQFIFDTDRPRFEYEDGSEALVIADKNRFNNVYLINVTLENLGQFSTQLNSLKKFNLIQGREWPWSVFINDLRVISELIEFPTAFLLFLQRRIRANDYPQFSTTDELDFLMFYFHEGLYFENGILKGVDSYIPHAYTEDLDRYYDYLAGRVSSAEKPRQKIAREYKNLIINIESIGKYGFTKATTTLLNFDTETQRTVLDNLAKAKERLEKDGNDHDFTMHSQGLNLGLTISVGMNRRLNFWSKMDSYCKLKMHQTKLKEWIFITVDIQKDGKEVFDFRIYNN